jgi:hypothetical protein
MKTKFTPGPWKVESQQNSDFKAWEVVGPKPNEWIAECGYGGNSEACARFIAAAPDIYAALGTINRLTSPGNRTFDELMRDMGLACDIARAALTKAQGGAA